MIMDGLRSNGVVTENAPDVDIEDMNRDLIELNKWIDEKNQSRKYHLEFTLLTVNNLYGIGAGDLIFIAPVYTPYELVAHLNSNYGIYTKCN